MADLSVVAVRRVPFRLVEEGIPAEFLRHEGSDDLMESGVHFFFRDVIGDLDIEHDLDVFHKCTDSLLMA